MDGAHIISPGLKTGAGGGSAFSPLQSTVLQCALGKGCLAPEKCAGTWKKMAPFAEEGTDGRVLYSQLQGSQIVH